MHCGHALNTADEFIKGKCYECQQEVERLMKTLPPGTVIPYNPKKGVTVQVMREMVEKCK